MDHFNRSFSKNNNNNVSHPASGTGGPSVKDEREGCRSLICDANGIIIAEMVYRCMICSAVADSIADAKIHYHNNHIDNDVENGGSCSDPLMFPDEELSMDLSSEEEDHLPHSFATTPAIGTSSGRSGAGQHHHHHQHHNHNSSDSMTNMVGYRNDEDFKPSGTSGGRKKISRKPVASDPIPSKNNSVPSLMLSTSATPFLSHLFRVDNGTNACNEQTDKRQHKERRAVNAIKHSYPVVDCLELEPPVATACCQLPRRRRSLSHSRSCSPLRAACCSTLPSACSELLGACGCVCVFLLNLLIDLRDPFLCPPSQTDVKIQTSGTNGTCTIKSGYITCPVCSCTKFYTTLQRRYGQFSCVGCYRFFKEFFVKPKRYGCPNLGSCPLDVRTKCKGCWIKKCIDTYSVDEQRKSLLMAHRPVKKAAAGKSPTTRQQQHHHHQQQQTAGHSHVNNSISSPVNDSSNENIEPDHDGLDEEEEDGGDVHGSGEHEPHYHSVPPEAKKIKTEPDLTESTLNGADEDEENNSLEDGEDFPADETENEGSSLLLPASAAAAAAVSFESSMLEAAAAAAAVTPPASRSGKTPPRRKTSGRIKNWCCLKCANCLADDCGKCINCLDRPKFGGPFIRKQRCLYKKCLMKTKPIPNNASF